jgi:hypothetical protein
MSRLFLVSGNMEDVENSQHEFYRIVMRMLVLHESLMMNLTRELRLVVDR